MSIVFRKESLGLRDLTACQTRIRALTSLFGLVQGTTLARVSCERHAPSLTMCSVSAPASACKLLTARSASGTPVSTRYAAWYSTPLHPSTAVDAAALHAKGKQTPTHCHRQNWPSAESSRQQMAAGPGTLQMQYHMYCMCC